LRENSESSFFHPDGNHHRIPDEIESGKGEAGDAPDQQTEQSETIQQFKKT
jgi:hypothetical protein|tara:strand:- start:251 stop:403 length:153 start_codon:yes stop_codon:yes gene_type:complete